MAEKMAETVVETRVRTTGIDHVVLHVGDLARSKKFYIDILGMREHHGGDTHMFLKCGAQVIGLFEVGAGDAVTSGPELNHLALNIEAGGYDDVKAWLERHGIAVSGRQGDPRCVYFDDPDGHRLQLMVARGA